LTEFFYNYNYKNRAKLFTTHGIPVLTLFLAFIEHLFANVKYFSYLCSRIRQIYLTVGGQQCFLGLCPMIAATRRV